jgi:hypothetical protein
MTYPLKDDRREVRRLFIHQSTKGADMAKYTAPIDEETRQRILALPKGIHFPAFMKKAIGIFVEELEKDPHLKPENFVITVTARKDASDRKRR